MADSKKAYVTEQQVVEASVRASNQIILGLANYRATDPAGIRIEVLKQRDIPPEFHKMLQAIIARHIRGLLDGECA